MLDTIRKNKINVLMTILFGAVWVLIIPVILGIEKISKKYPKVCKCIGLTIYYVVMAVCVYFLSFKHQLSFLPILICMMMPCCNTMKEQK